MQIFSNDNLLKFLACVRTGPTKFFDSCSTACTTFLPGRHWCTPGPLSSPSPPPSCHRSPIGSLTPANIKVNVTELLMCVLVVFIGCSLTPSANSCSYQCCGSMTFWGGFGSGSGSADPCLWLMDPDPDADPDPAIFVIDLPNMPTKN
jgi:hypothetical protein